MRRFLWLLPLLLFATARPASAQLANAQGWCESGNMLVNTSGLLSTNLVQGSFPQCTVSVSIHGGGTATIFSTGASAPLSNPFTAATNGRWIFYAANGEYDITLTCTTPCVPPQAPLTNPFPVTYSDIFITNVTSGGGGSGPTLQTNGVNNTSQTILNQINGSNTTITSGAAGAVTFTAVPTSTTAGCAQYNNAGAFGCASGVTTPDGSNWLMKGADPWADVAAFGARPNVITLADGSTTGTINSGSNSLSIASAGGAGNWVNGDGVTIQGAGATFTLSTPSAPTVTPSFLAGEALTHDVVNSNTGSSTYAYCIISRDKFGGFSPCSATTTITNGLSSLGLQTANVTAVSLSNDTLSVTSTTGLTAHSLVDLAAVTGFPWVCCWYRVSTNSGTVLTFTAFPIDSRAMPSNLKDITTGVSVGGTLAYYTLNYISWPAISNAWEYIVCAERPGDVSFHVIGVTKPSDNGVTDISFEDLGSTYLGNQSYQYYITDSICTGSGQNDPLTTTVTSGAGTTTMLLANNAINNVTSTKVLHDSAPNILAAAKSVSTGSSPFSPGTVLIPPSANPNSYPINSFLQLPSGVKIQQAGSLLVGETIQTNATIWDGSWSNQGVGQFGNCGGAIIHGGTGSANPFLYFAGGSNFIRNLNINSSSNAVVEAVSYNQDFTADCISWASDGGASTDYAGINFYGNSNVSVINYFFTNSLFTGGPDQVQDKSWTPLVVIASSSGCPIVKFEKVNWARRGEANGCGPIADWSYRQGGITPMFAIQEAAVNSAIFLKNVYQDTEGNPVLVNWQASSPPAQGSTATLDNVTGGTINQLIQGNRLVGLDLRNYSNGGSNVGGEPNRNFHEENTTVLNTIYSPYAAGGATATVPIAVQRFAEPLVMQGGFSMGAALNPPTSIACVNAAGGSVPSGTYVYSLSSIDYRGGSSMIQPQNPTSCTATPGNNTNNLTWVAALGAVTYNVYRAATSVNCISGGAAQGCNFNLVASGVTGTSFSDTSATTTNNAPQATTGFISGLDNTAVWTPSVAGPETTAPSAVTGFDIVYPDSTAHAFKECANGGTCYQVPQTICSGQVALTTGAISSGTRATNTLSCTGLSASTDTANCDFSGDTNAVTGYAPNASGGLSLKVWISANTINIDQVNNTSGSITPGAATINCKGIH